MYRVGPINAASKQRQFARWLNNAKINPGLIYYYPIKAMLHAWAGQSIDLALDSTTLWDRFTLVRLALIYRGLAIPISWVVLTSASASVAFKDYKIILLQAAWVLPLTCQVMLLADWGFDDVALMQHVRDLGWGFRTRLKSSIWVHRA